jgi:hypothetical protein
MAGPRWTIRKSDYGDGFRALQQVADRISMWMTRHPSILTSDRVCLGILAVLGKTWQKALTTEDTELHRGNTTEI